jgi:hypothetical protein
LRELITGVSILMSLNSNAKTAQKTLPHRLAIARAAYAGRGSPVRKSFPGSRQ